MRILSTGVPARRRTELPPIGEPQTWEFSAHPHRARIAGLRIDMQLGNPKTRTVGGFKHDEARDMLESPDNYIGRVAKVRARKVFHKDGEQSHVPTKIQRVASR